VVSLLLGHRRQSVTQNHRGRLALIPELAVDHDGRGCQALRFYVDQLGFVMREDKRLGDYRWLPVSAQQSKDEVSINLELARTLEQQALVGKQGGGKPVFGGQPTIAIATFER